MICNVFIFYSKELVLCPSWRKPSFRLSTAAYSINPHLSCIAGCHSPSGTWDRAMLWRQETKRANRSFWNISQFKYLGTRQKFFQEDIKSRFISGNACYHLVQNLLSFHLLSKNLKLRICETLVVSEQQTPLCFQSVCLLPSIRDYLVDLTVVNFHNIVQCKFIFHRFWRKPFQKKYD
jgi:hypothetical protein